MSKHCKNCTPLSPRARFYKSLRGFIITMSGFLLASLLIDNGFFDLFKLIGAIWGISLAVRYIKFEGIPGTHGWLSEDWFEWIKNRYPYDPSKRPNKKGGDGKDYDPLWKDKDLV